jgi:thymidine phosphorylase
MTFRRVVREAGCAIIGQTDDLAPADRRLYAIRDVTGTVESIALIAASILSKKLAEGLDGLVMDVKTGSGAFLPDHAMSCALAESIVAIATGAGVPTVALLTDMDAVLGRSVGNALEVVEAVDYLAGRRTRDPRLHDVVLALAAEMLVIGGLAVSLAQARTMAETRLADGGAAEAFARMVTALGGPADLMARPGAYLRHAPVIRPCTAEQTGVIVSIETRQIGIAVINLGGGRRRASDLIDPAVGFTEVRGVGDAIAKGEPLAIVHAAGEGDAAAAIAALRGALRIADATPSRPPVIRARIDATTNKATAG